MGVTDLIFSTCNFAVNDYCFKNKDLLSYSFAPENISFVAFKYDFNQIYPLDISGNFNNLYLSDTTSPNKWFGPNSDSSKGSSLIIGDGVLVSTQGKVVDVQAPFDIQLEIFPLTPVAASKTQIFSIGERFKLKVQQHKTRPGHSAVIIETGAGSYDECELLLQNRTWNTIRYRSTQQGCRIYINGQYCNLSNTFSALSGELSLGSNEITSQYFIDNLVGTTQHLLPNAAGNWDHVVYLAEEVARSDVSHMCEGKFTLCDKISNSIAFIRRYGLSNNMIWDLSTIEEYDVQTAIGVCCLA